MRWGSRILLAGGVTLLAIQLIRPARTNPPSRAEEALAAPADVSAVLSRACADCHSNHTRWPWYSQVAPVSWLLVHDVNDGREHVNYSEWSRYGPDRQQKLLKETCAEMREGEMPPWYYVPLHRSAKPTPADIQVVCDWTGQRGGGAGDGS